MLIILPFICPACGTDYGYERRAAAQQVIENLQCPLCTMSYHEAVRVKQELAVYSEAFLTKHKGNLDVSDRSHRH